MTGTPSTAHSAAVSSLATSALDRAVMISSRRERNFSPGVVTVTLHTSGGSVAVEGRPCGLRVAAPGFPQLTLPTYKFQMALSGLSAANTDLATFLAAFTEAVEREAGRPGGRIVLAVHADVDDDDFSDAYAWRYDFGAKSFQTVLPADAADLFHEDTHVLAYPWDKAPWPSISALAPAGPTA